MVADSGDPALGILCLFHLLHCELCRLANYQVPCALGAVRTVADSKNILLAPGNSHHICSMDHGHESDFLSSLWGPQHVPGAYSGCGHHLDVYALALGAQADEASLEQLVVD
jgi:hypothetical protein